jgi:nucleotide-binding universal stress UspA family protein
MPELFSNPTFPREPGDLMTNTYNAAFSATKILLPIDFSTSSEAALEAATGLAKQFHASVHLVHIIPEFPDFNGSDFFPVTEVRQERTETIEQKLAGCKEQLESQGVRTTVSIETGNDIVGNLMIVLKREKADMIVISTHGLSGWRPMILGSIAEQVIKLVNCTLLLLHSVQRSVAPEESAIETWEDTFAAPNVEVNSPASSTPTPESSAQRRLNRSADKLAKQGERTEQHYDVTHSIFTK